MLFRSLDFLRKNGNRIQALLPDLGRDVTIPREATLRVSYKQQREIEKLEFKIFWSLREECKLETNQKSGTFPQKKNR